MATFDVVPNWTCESRHHKYITPITMKMHYAIGCSAGTLNILNIIIN